MISRLLTAKPRGRRHGASTSLDKPPGRRVIEDVNPSQNGNTELMPGPEVTGLFESTA